MNFDDYFKLLSLIAKQAHEVGTDTFLWLEQGYKKGSGPIWEAVEWRKSVLSPADVESAGGYLPIGYLRDEDETTRLSFFTVYFEVGPELHRLNILRTCEKYRQNHPIFQTKPALWNEVRRRSSEDEELELLSLRLFKQYEDSELFEFNGTNFILTRALRPTIVSWSKESFPSVPMFARFNPYRSQQDRIRLLEFAMLVPPNPRWWANTNLLRGQVDGGCFILQDCPCTRENQTQFWEFKIKGLRKLEISAKRENNLNLKMTLEELSVDGNGIVGRMIHLDSNCRPGTPADKCLLNHLDLAINYYLDDSAKTRMAQKLSDGGRVVDASNRIHLFRIENIPLSSVLAYVDMFFESTILKKEWRDSQLGG